MTQVNKTVKPELKHHDVVENRRELFNSFLSTAMYNLTSISQGTQDTQRIGDRIQLKSILVRLLLQYNTNPQDRTPLIRIIVFQWKEDNGAVAPLPQNILQSATGGVPGDVLRPYTLDTNQTYKVLFDKIFSLSINAGSDTIVSDIYINKKFGKLIEYSNAVTTGTNQIYLMAVTSDNIGITTLGELPLMTMRSRVRYTDS